MLKDLRNHQEYSISWGIGWKGSGSGKRGEAVKILLHFSEEWMSYDEKMGGGSHRKPAA